MVPQLQACKAKEGPTKMEPPGAFEGDAIVVDYTISIDGVLQPTMSGEREPEFERMTLESCGLPLS